MTIPETGIEHAEASGAKPRKAFFWPSVRFLLSIGVSVLFCLLIWRTVPRSLTGHADILGYPIFADFNIKRYYDAFYILAIAFPLFTFVAYHIITVASRRRSSARLRPVFPITVSEQAPMSTEDVEHASLYSVFWSIVRVAIPASVVAVEVSVTRSPHVQRITHAGVAAGAAYVVLVISLSIGLAAIQGRTRTGARHRRHTLVNLPTSMSTVNALLGLSVVTLLYGVSASTAISVGVAPRVVRYPWFPLWLSVVATLALAWWTVRGLRQRPGPSGRNRIEARTLVIVVGSVAIFLFTAFLPGPLGQFQAFDDSQYLAAPQLIFGQGLHPWSQIVAFHGLLYDVLGGGLGMVVFGNSRWGSAAGQLMFLHPALWIAFYLMGAYFLRRYRILVAALALAMILGVFPGDFRWLFYPLLFVGLHQVLKHRNALWTAAFTTAVLIQAVVVPETDLIAAVLLLTVIAFEFATRQKRGRWRDSFARTRWSFAAGIFFLICFSGYLLGTGSLGAFIDYYRAVVPVGPGLEGGIPIGRVGILLTFNGQASLRDTVELVLPGVLILLTVWLVVAKLRRRSPWTLTQWVMIPAAIGVLLYYEEALGRLDNGHIDEMFLAATPLILLWVRQAADFAEMAVEWYRRRVSSVGQKGRYAVTGATLVTLGAVLIWAPTSSGALRSAPSHFHPSAPAPPPAQFARLGYTVPGSVNTTEIEDLKTVLDTYTKSGQPVYDFDNDVGVPYYLLNRVPGTRFTSVLAAWTSYAQHLLIADLMKSKPRLVIFSNATFGLPAVDSYQGVPIWDMVHIYGVSQYLLDHYRPLANVDGQLVMLRSDLFGKVPPLPHVSVAPVTDNLYFSLSSCAWGYSPNFLDPPPSGPGHSSLKLAVAGQRIAPETVSGWAVTKATSNPATTIVAVRQGQVVAQIQPALDRPDVVTTLGSSTALTSGFRLSIPVGTGPLTIFAVNTDGTASPLAGAGITLPAMLPTSISLPDGQSVAVVTGADLGSVDFGTPRSRVWTLRAPAGTNLSRYRWLTITSRGGDGKGTFALSTSFVDPNHEITWWSLPQSEGRLSVQVGSCLQWHGFGGSVLQLATQDGGSLGSATLSD